MNTEEFIHTEKYQRILTNVLERLLDFYIILYSAKCMNGNIVTHLTEIKNDIESNFLKKQLDKEILTKLNAVDDTLDIMQVNYSYCRALTTKEIMADNALKMAYQKIAIIVYERNSGNRVEMVNGRPCIQEEIIAEQLSAKDFMPQLKMMYPCLHLIRIVDIINAPSLEIVIPLIENAVKSYLRLNRINANQQRNVIDAAIDDLTKLVRFYPERLYPGLQYRFPQYNGNDDYENLALSFNHRTSKNDMQDALIDVSFQFERFKAYYHHKAGFTDETRLMRLEPFAYKYVRENGYIKQLNSIEGTFHALLAWQKIHFDKKSQASAIDEIYRSLNKLPNVSIQEGKYKKRIRDRLSVVSEFVKDKISYINKLSDDDLAI